MRRRILRLAAVLAAALLAPACVAADAAPGGEVRVFAAASLRGVFDELASAFEAAEGVGVRPVYDGSSTLAAQLLGGAQADVFAAADEATMRAVTDAGLAAEPELFAANTLVIAVPAGNPAGITELADLADPDTTVVLCAPEVPCGAASETLLANAGVAVTPKSVEQHVTAVRTKVAAGEADAGLVYATDVLGDADVEAITPAGASEVVNRYPIAALTDAAVPAAADAFIAFVLGAEGRRILADHGFGTP